MIIRESRLETDRFYYIFNRGINSRPVFLNNENYKYFLQKASLYLIPYFDIYGYCLMANHFHFILKTNPERSEFSAYKDSGLHSEESFFSKTIGKLISSYTQSFNKVYQRSGPLFESPFKRILIDSEDELKNLIIYIHQNAESFQNYKFSSYLAVISSAETHIKRKEMIELFGNRENFIESHKKN